MGQRRNDRRELERERERKSELYDEVFKSSCIKICTFYKWIEKDKVKEENFLKTIYNI